MILPNQPDTTLLDALVEGYIAFFRKADERITWTDSEREMVLRLNDDTALVGRVDQLGITEDGDRFFQELKTQKPPPKNKRESWKAEWRMNPQSLTYGVLVDSVYPGTRRFTVRKAFKQNPPAFDFEWFKYSTEEINWWRHQLKNIAEEIRVRRVSREHWTTNFTSCFRYGVAYVCPFFYPACNQLKWDGKPEGAEVRVPHLEIEKKLISGWQRGFYNTERLVILDATRVDAYMVCPERYRREYEDGVREPAGEALEFGKAFHALVGQHYKNLIKGASNGRA